MRHLTVTLILLLVSSSLAVAQDRPVPQPPDSARQAAVAQFQQEHAPEWWIAWTPITDEGSEIRMMWTGGTEKRTLYDRGREQAWGQNSERIVFSKPASESDYTALWIVDRDGSNLRQITNPSRNPLN